MLSEPDLQLILSFHGHYCPMVLMGARQARTAVKGFELLSGHSGRAYSFYRGYGCALDGIQIFSGCTLGNGNLTLLRGKDFSLIFTYEGLDSAFIVKPREDLLVEIRTRSNSSLNSPLSERILKGADGDLFSLDEVEGTGVITLFPEDG